MDGPTITENDIIVSVGGSIDAVCSAEGIPAPSIEWYGPDGGRGKLLFPLPL